MFLTANIDRGIVMTQYDLRGFAHPLGFRCEGVSPKNLNAITGNLVAFCSFNGDDTSEATDESYIDYFKRNYEQCLNFCTRLAADCDLSQREAIQLIVQEIVRQSEQLKAEVQAGTREPSAYLEPLDKTNAWGITVLALAEAFEVVLQLPQSA